MGRLAHQPQEIARFASEAERLGAASFWVGDRLLAPVKPTVGYGGTDEIPEAFHSVLDPFALMAAAAAVTRTAVIGSNVLIAPWYPPALLARSLTTIDLVSGGRLMAGFGTGWSPDEYQAVGIPMNERGARLDECLDALESLWTLNPASHEGKYWSIPATHVELRPVQVPRPPVYLGGYSEAAMRRTARRADGWLPVVVPGLMEFDADAITAPMNQIGKLAAEHGRDPGNLDMILRVYPQGNGTADDVVEFLTRAAREAGITHAFVDMMNIATEVDQALDIVDRLVRKCGTN
ncbi:TIGR03619 family F420-dependent LLM class oxidoreductase [Amycolatopsis sp.]|jgi:probable F420-dependent oxidoreductase|uniref:TIGR03619 family F420-dependent LLM class oxidoreductase n=1 Tax=Amycolatopsis sp. TaxID=37632 RepID=UPI00262AB73B|nr:TIGR03619 family F420-dependent LLM class oxidoreductase [Amycolatopsis sp.]